MTPAARVQTAIELLDRIIEAARAKAAPADRILAEWFRSNRFAGLLMFLACLVVGSTA